MTSNIKNTTDRLLAGFKDYFLNKQSFDGRYVCGELFLYGKAKACDVGIPGRYEGTDEVKLNYFLTWFIHHWSRTGSGIIPFKRAAKEHHIYKDAKVRFLANLTSPITVEDYTNVINSLTEALQVASVNAVKVKEYESAIIKLLPLQSIPGVIKVNKPNELSNYFVKLLTNCLERLNRDYDGEHLYPTATLTFLSVMDQLSVDMVYITRPDAFELISINDSTDLTEKLIRNTFQACEVSKLLEEQTFDVLIMALKNFKSLTHIIAQTQLTMALMNDILGKLTKKS